MRAFARRIARLENQFGPAGGKPQLLAVVCHAGYHLEHDTSIPILRECGHLPSGPVAVVILGDIPDGLNAEERESFLRNRGAEICFPRVPNPK